MSRQLEQSFHTPSKQGCSCIDARTPAFEREIFIQQRSFTEDGFLINIALLNVHSILPKQVVGGNGFAVDLFHRGLPDVDEDVVQRHEIIPARDAVFVTNDGVVDEVDALGNISAFIILLRVPITHTSNRSHRIVGDYVPFNAYDPVRDIGVVDKLDTIFAVAGNNVIADGNVERGTAVFVQANLNAVVITIANHIVGNDGFGGAIQVNCVVLIVLEGVELAKTAAAFVVNRIIVMDEPIVKDVSFPTASDAIVSVLNGESNNLQFWAGPFGDFDNEGSLLFTIIPLDNSVKYSLVDVLLVACIQEARCQRNVLFVQSNRFVVNPRTDKHYSAISGGVNRYLDALFVLGNSNYFSVRRGFGIAVSGIRFAIRATA